MSKTIRTFSYAVTIEDPGDWPEEIIEAADKDDADSYDDFVIARLDSVMREAGNQFIADNPEIFATNELV